MKKMVIGEVPPFGKKVKLATGGGVAKLTVTVAVAGVEQGEAGPEALYEHIRTV